MKRQAIEQAKERLERAREALSQIEEAKTFKTIEKAWSDFLQAASAIYSKFEQGAKGCGKSEGWYGRKKHDRKKDELLSYIHHARNTDHHGLGGTTLQYSQVKILNDKVQGLRTSVDKDGNSVIKPVGEGAEIEVVNQYSALKMVTDDRYGDSFMPPRNHLGKPFGDPDPKGLVDAKDVARLGYAYLESLLAEAAQLPLHI